MFQIGLCYMKFIPWAGSKNRPAFVQESRRICTTRDSNNIKIEKNRPIIRFFLTQDNKMLEACYYARIKDCQELGYEIHKSTEKVVTNLKESFVAKFKLKKEK